MRGLGLSCWIGIGVRGLGFGWLDWDWGERIGLAGLELGLEDWDWAGWIGIGVRGLGWLDWDWGERIGIWLAGLGLDWQEWLMFRPLIPDCCLLLHSNHEYGKPADEREAQPNLHV